MRLLLYPIVAALCWMGICALVPSGHRAKAPAARTAPTAMETAQAFGSR